MNEMTAMKKNEYQNYVILFYLFLSMPIIASLVLLFIPMVQIQGQGIQKVFAYVVPIIFWGSVLSEGICLLKINSLRKQIMLLRAFKEKKAFQKRIGLISFFKNKEALIIDVVLFVSAVAEAIFSILQLRSEWLHIVCISIIFMSLNLHGILNGINYSYFIYVKKILKDKEKMRNERD